MQKSTNREKMARRLALAAALALATAGTKAATFSVSNTNDAGLGSLRQALVGASASASNTVAFNIPGTGPFRITPQSPLPVLSQPVVIDASTQPGYGGTPVVEVAGENAGAGVNGLTLTGGGSIVRGLAIFNFGNAGISLQATGGNRIEGNYLGTDATGTNNAANAGAGLEILGGDGNVIGGLFYGSPNLIAFNQGPGVGVLSGVGNWIVANSIFGNTGLDIDLGFDGVTPNDPGDTDTGPNNLQNFPVLTSVDASGGQTFVGGVFDGAPATTIQLDFYGSPTMHPSGHGDATTYLGSTAITTDSGGHASFLATLNGMIAPGSYISATATDPANNTSEFSSAAPFAPLQPVKLEVSVTADSASVLAGDQLVYSITVINSGTNVATGVVVTDSLPNTMNFVYAGTSQGTVVASNSLVTANLGTLAPGEVAAVVIFVSPQVPGLYGNSVALTADEFNLDQTHQTAAVMVNVYVPSPPTIVTPPLSQLVNLGGLLNLVVEAVGPPGLRFQWRLNGANIPGATNFNYIVNSLLAKDAGSYTVDVYDGLGIVTSPTALVSLSGLLTLPAADNFANRGPILNLLNLVSYSNRGATSEPGEPLHAGVPGGKSVWFTWTPLVSGTVTFSTAGSSFDTLLAVYTGNSLATLSEVASDDDSAGFYTSTVTFNAVAGTAYQIAVDGAYGAEGTIVLSSSFALLGPAVAQIVNQPADQVVLPGGTGQFSVQALGTGLTYQWYHNDVAVPGATHSSLQVPNVGDNTVGLYRVMVGTPGRSVWSHPASLQVAVVDGVVAPAALAEDKFQALMAILGGQKLGLKGDGAGGPVLFGGGPARGYTGTQIFSTYNSASQPGEPHHCNTPGGASSWVSVQAEATGVMTMDTDGSNFRTILGVYTGNGNDFSTLVPVACDVGSGQGGTNSRVVFAVQGGTIYYVGVDGINGAYGTVHLNWNLAVPPSITANPASQTVSVGGSVTLSAGATGTPAPTGQWYFNNAAIPGATSWTFTVTNFQSSVQGTYSLTATNSAGSAITAAATLTVGTLRLDSFSRNVTNGLVRMRLIGLVNSNYVIQVSSNLSSWIPVATNSSPTGMWQFSETPGTNNPRRFYRAVRQ